jgi:hypothetical protein
MDVCWNGQGTNYGIIKCYTDGTIRLLRVFEAQFSACTPTQNAMLRFELTSSWWGPYGKLLGRPCYSIGPIDLMMKASNWKGSIS